MTESQRPRVVVMGSGMSGILMGIKLLHAGVKNFRIYEKAAKVGGTWRENTYPARRVHLVQPPGGGEPERPARTEDSGDHRLPVGDDVEALPRPRPAERAGGLGGHLRR